VHYCPDFDQLQRVPLDVASNLRGMKENAGQTGIF